MIVQNSSGDELFRLTGVPNVNRVSIEPSDTMLIDIGFPRVPSEPGSNDVPTYGWQYKDLTLQFIP